MAEGWGLGVLVLDRLTWCSYGRVSAGVVCSSLWLCMWAPWSRSGGCCPIKVLSTALRNSLSSPSDTNTASQPDTKYTGTRDLKYSSLLWKNEFRGNSPGYV